MAALDIDSLIANYVIPLISSPFTATLCFAFAELRIADT
jgi:hypothetical protein